MSLLPLHSKSSIGRLEPTSFSCCAGDTYMTEMQRLCGSVILQILDVTGSGRTLDFLIPKLRPGIPLKCLHDKMKQEGRMGAYSQFDEIVLLSTDIASRGLDFNQAVEWVVQANNKKLQPVSGLLSASLFKYPDTLPGLAKRTFNTYIKSIQTHKDKEVFDMMRLPIDEYSASIGLPMTPKIRFSNYKMKFKKPLKEGLLQINDIPTERGDIMPATRVSKKKKLVDPLARLAAPSDSSILDGLQDKIEQYHKRLREEVKKTGRHPTYFMCSSHGTTIIWVRISPTELLVGVDSQLTQPYKADDRNKTRGYEVLTSETDQKFVNIIDDVYGTLCGDAGRCWMMVNHILQKMEGVIGRATLSDVGDAAVDYFSLNPRNPETEFLSVVFLCSWNLDIKQYEVLAVGDHFERAISVEANVFGYGSGSGPGLDTLTGLEAPIDINTLVKIMMTAAGTDSHSGGQVRVYSLKSGNCKAVYERKLIDELYDYNVEYEGMLYTGNSMFVIIPRAHERIQLTW